MVKPSGSLASVRCSIAQWSGVMFPNSDNCVQRAILVLDNLFFVPRSESFWYPSEQEGRNHQKNANKQTNKVEIRLFLDWLDCGVCCLREFHDTVQLQRTTQGHQVLSQCYDPERFQSIHQQWSLQLRDSAVDISIDRRTETDLFKGHVPLHRQLSPLFVKSLPPFPVSLPNTFRKWYCYWSRCCTTRYPGKSLLHQDISHSSDIFVAVIWVMRCLVTTRVGVIVISASTKSNSGITSTTIIFLVSNITDSCFRMRVIFTNRIEPFFVAVPLQRGSWANQLLPCVTTQWGGAVIPIGDEWV